MRSCRAISALVLLAGTFTLPATACYASIPQPNPKLAQLGAQALFGSVTGHVGISGSKTPASGIVLVFANLTTHAEHRVQTDANGEYRILELPPGTYDIGFILHGAIVNSGKTVQVLPNKNSDGSILIPASGEPTIILGGHEKQVDEGAHAAPPPTPPPPPTPKVPVSHMHAVAPKNDQPAPAPAPAPTQTPAPTPSAPHPQAAPVVITQAPIAPHTSHQPPDESTVKWLKNLPLGQILPFVDNLMYLNKQATVSVTIGGPGAAPLGTPGVDKPASLNVSPYMWVELSEPDNPGAFDLEPQDTPQNPKRVVSGVKTTWTWTVTPKQLGSQKLHIEAFVMQGEDATTRVDYGPPYNANIDVRIDTFKWYTLEGITFIFTHPAQCIQYWLTGGGAVILGWLIAWWRKRQKSSSTANSKKTGT